MFSRTRARPSQELVHIISDAEPAFLAAEPDLLTMATEVHCKATPAPAPAHLTIPADRGTCPFR